MRVLVSSTGTVRHAAALTDGTLCNTTGSSRGHVRWYWRDGDVTCKNCLRKLVNGIAAAWDEAHAMAALPADVVPTEAEQPAAEVTPATDTGSLAAASARTVAGVRAVRTRVAIGSQIAVACAALGIELGHGTAKGLPRYVVNGTEYTARELADLVLEGGFDGAYGRAETIVRQDSPLEMPAVLRDRNSFATLVEPEIIEMAEFRSRLLRSLLEPLTVDVGPVLSFPRGTKVTWRAEPGEIGTVVEDGRPFVDVIMNGVESVNADYLRVATEAEIAAPQAPAEPTATPHGLIDATHVVDLHRSTRCAGCNAVDQWWCSCPEGYTPPTEDAQVDRRIADLSKGFPVYGDFRRKYTVTEAGEKIATEYGDALVVLGQEETGEDVRAKAHPYRPAVGEWVVGRPVTARNAGADVIGMFQGIKRSRRGDGFDYAHLEDFNGMVLAADPDSLRPAPQVPDASHLIGCTLTAELEVGDHGLRTGVVADVLRPSADGRYVVVRFGKPGTWVVRVPVGVVERTASMAVSHVEKLPASGGVEHWGVRVKPGSTMVNLVVTQPELPKRD